MTSEAGKYIFRTDKVWWGVRSILLLPLVARCIEAIYVQCMYMAHGCVCCCDCVAAVVKYSVV